MNDDHMAYQSLPFLPDWQLIIDGGRFASRKHTVFALIEVDVTTARRILHEHKARTGEALSFTWKKSMKLIPISHLDLIDGPFTVALSTIMPDGQPQTTPVWCNRKDGFILINVMRGFRKEKNMRANPKVSLLAYDPKNPLHNIEIRGCVVEMTEEGAVEHDDELARLYLGKPDAKFFGDAVPAELQSRYTPVRVKIAPTHIRVEG